MPGPEPLHLCLSLVPGTAPVRGSIRLAGQPERGFAGWTELFAALEATLEACQILSRADTRPRAEGEDGKTRG
jgi:hypothetical protein